MVLLLLACAVTWAPSLAALPAGQRPGARGQAPSSYIILSAGLGVGVEWQGDRGRRGRLRADGDMRYRGASVLRDESALVASCSGGAWAGLGLLKWDAERPLRLTKEGWDAYPCASPDGRAVAFTRRGALMVVDVRTGRVRSVVGSPEERGWMDPYYHALGATMPTWRPDGKELAYVDARFGGVPHVRIVDAQGRRTRAITRGGYGFYSPSWSPDGKTIACLRNPVRTRTKRGDFRCDLQDPAQLVLVDVRGGAVRRLGRLQAAWDAPCWHPSGRYMAVVCGRAPHLRVMLVDTSGRVIAKGRRPAHGKLAVLWRRSTL